MKRTMRCAGLCLLFLLCLDVLRVHAQQPIAAESQVPRSGTDSGAAQSVVVPRMVKFSGVARDLMGHARSGVVGLTFAIYKEQEGGATLWMETQNVELDEQGRYSVLLGATKNEGLPVELFAAAEPRWLGVQVNLPGEVEQPRVLLVSVPYALKAADAENLGGRPASSYALATGDIATGPDSGGAGGSAGSKPGGGKKTGKAAATPATVTGTMNFIPVFTDNAGSLGNSVMVQSSNGVGVLQGPTSNPTVQLDVNGGIRGTGLATGGRNTTPDAINTNSLFLNGSNAMAVIGTSNAAFAPGVLFTKLSFFAGNGTATAERLTVDGTTGNVGIGTTIPGSKLEVDGNTTAFNTAIVAAVEAGSNPATTLTFSPTTVPPVAVGGLATATSGTVAGVGGTSLSPNGAGVGALNFATTGGVGVFAASAGTGGDGVDAFNVATSGGSRGIHAGVMDASGVAGLFDNNPGGDLLIGRTGGSGAHVNQFRVDGTGKGFFNGGTQTGGADFAESVAVRGERLQYEPGDVLVVDRAAGRRLMLSRRPYSTRVAGIYSTKPGVLATIHSIDESDALAAEVPVAIVGIVPCKVTAENGPILPGDLLVTSSMPGYAMKGTNRAHMLGAVIGKALESLREGKGVIQVLVTLQ